ncbi:LON peptidase substrate-binding domain-containing protein [Paracoccus pacificus]|uniref:LON peptidase substrate-binding domain-containing protein n=1 Tax=Paracoccus pacificus TaxID=1463598 RepID=A0ABW4R2H0_9RHOB
MLRHFDLPVTLPLFPLAGALLLPRTRLPLHIYEPRYLQMLEDVMKTGNRLIGMMQPIGDGLGQIGCAGRLVGFSETDEGRMMISLRAVSRFRLTDVEDGFAPYLRGRADWSGFDADQGPAETDPDLDRPILLERLKRYMDQHGLSTDWDAVANAEDETLINSLAILLPFEPEEKQALLEAGTLAERRAVLETLIEFELLNPGGGEERLQ